MARIRTIKPEITTDEKLARVSRDARLTFIYAISQADDDGLLPGNPRQLLAALFPMDETVTDRILAFWVKELVDMGVFRWRETKQGAPVLEIAKWSDHQRIDHKGKSLLLPNLKPFHEDDASDSRESREGVASVSRSDLGPRTVDHGPTSASAADAPPDIGAPAVGRRHGRTKSPAPVTWVAEGVAWWTQSVGAMTHGRFGKALSDVVAAHAWDAVFPDLVLWVTKRKAEGKPCKLEWYADEASARITAEPPPIWDPVQQCLTPYGERVTRPDKVPA